MKTALEKGMKEQTPKDDDIGYCQDFQDDKCYIIKLRLQEQQKQHEAEIARLAVSITEVQTNIRKKELKEIQKELELLRISKVHQKCPHCNKIVTLKLKRD